jgi:hypothetical protein
MATQSIATAQTGMRFPGDFTLKNLTLLTAAGTFDLKPILVEMSYYEDVFANAVTGNLVVADAQGFIEKFQLIGNEYLRLTFTKGSKSTAFDVDMIFRVFKMSLRSLVGNLQTEAYVLHFCSEELLLSEQYKISKSYNGRTISSIIQDICGPNYLNIPKNKPVNIQKTNGIYSFVVPTFKPFEAINWLSTYAKPATGKPGADMVFFENKEGFNFVSLQSLFEKETYRTYTYAPKNIDSKTQTQEQHYFAVLAYEFDNGFDTLDAINSGLFANQLISIDPLLQTYHITNFNYKEYNKQSTTLNKYGIVNDVKNRRGDTIYQTPQAVLKMATTNKGHNTNTFLNRKPGSVANEIFIETYIPNRTAQLSLANYNRIKLTINGDPGATVGQTIKFNLLSMSPSKKGLDKFYSGKYLITAVKHTIKIDEYYSVLEIVKDSATNEYTTPKESTIWKNSAKGVI